MTHEVGHRSLFHAGRIALVALLGLGIGQAAAAETETVSRTVPIASGGTLTVRNFSGKVTITGTDRTDVSVQAVRRAPRERLDRIKLDVRADGGNVVVEANHRDGAREDRDNVVETDLTIEAPRQVHLSVNAFSSPVEVRGITGTDHHVKTFSGSVTLDQVAGPVDAETFSGSIHLVPANWAGSENVKLHTFSGDIDVKVPADASASVEFDTFSGDLDSDVPLTFHSKSKRNLRADLNPSSSGTRAALSLHTFSGDVRLTK